jgi:hypothetical protein
MNEPDLRDFIAATITLPTDLSRATGRALAGEEPKDGIELIRWWATVKARMRYLEADAMLKERIRDPFNK